MIARQLWFEAPGKVEVRDQELRDLAEDEILVRTQCSGISAGTELLVYRGQLPSDISLDANIEALKDLDSTYPLAYGYASVGTIEAVGSMVDPAISGKLIFAFQPHASHFICKAAQVIFLPDEISAEAGIFLANMETAVNLLIDAAPQTNESVAIIGLGVVGQLVNSLLSEYSTKKVFALDKLAYRRKVAEQSQAATGINPDAQDLKGVMPDEGFGLVLELSGNPEALNLAIDICGFAGRIIVGSWYGNKSAALNLGGKFHRNRLKIISSQVSTIHPEHLAEWDKEKRLQKALQSIISLLPEKLITHRFHLNQAPEAYQLLVTEPDSALQVVFTYEDL
tara:strand:+ start:1787 stop:2800 length:1014 start_codon:yes stop_codon:yes gene_type:complete